MLPPSTPETALLLRVLDTHVTSIRDEMEKMRLASEARHVEVIELIEQGFPDGDLKSHYQYHMGLIEEAQNRKAIKLEIWKKLLSGSIWSVLAYAAFQSLQWIKDYVKL